MERLLKALRMGGNLPPEVSLSRRLRTEFDNLWRRSSRTEPFREWGASLVEAPNGALRTGIRVEGEGPTLAFPREVLDEQGCVGIFHTHSFASDAEGQAFSWPDFRLFFRSQLEIMVVQSGRHRFLIGKPAGFRPPSQEEEAELEITFGKWLASSWATDTITVQQALLLTNLKLSSRVGLCFYLGTDRLRRLVPA